MDNEDLTKRIGDQYLIPNFVDGDVLLHTKLPENKNSPESLKQTKNLHASHKQLVDNYLSVEVNLHYHPLSSTFL